MRWSGSFLLMSLCMAFFAGPAAAGANADARIALHAGPAALPFCGGPNDPAGVPTVPCASFVTNVSGAFGPGEELWLYLVVTNGDPGVGVSGLGVGVEHARLSGDYEVTWTRCADLELSNAGWPASGTGTRLTWAPQSNCQRVDLGDGRAAAVAGVFVLTAYYESVHSGYVKIVPRHVNDIVELAVAGCNAEEDQIPPSNAGWVGINEDPEHPVVPGCNPCLGPCDGPIAVQPATWGHLKRLFGED